MPVIKMASSLSAVLKRAISLLKDRLKKVLASHDSMAKDGVKIH